MRSPLLSVGLREGTHEVFLPARDGLVRTPEGYEGKVPGDDKARRGKLRLCFVIGVFKVAHPDIRKTL